MVLAGQPRLLTRRLVYNPPIEPVGGHYRSLDCSVRCGATCDGRRNLE